MTPISDFKLDQTLKKSMPSKKISLKESDLTIELLEEASVIMAKIIEIHGDHYLPIFIRIMDEIDKRKEQQAYKELAQRLLLEKK
jgi:hypothetical protein